MAAALLSAVVSVVSGNPTEMTLADDVDWPWLTNALPSQYAANANAHDAVVERLPARR